MKKNKIFLFILTYLMLITIMLAGNNGSASVGTVTIDGEIYNQIAYRPEIPIGRVKLGLDLYFYLDDEGNFYEKPWDFSTPKKAFENILDKILYLEYGGPADKFYFRLGGMPSATLGYGIIVNQYNNTLEYPNIRRLGLKFQYNGSNIGTEFIMSDIKRSPGLIATRTTFPIGSKFKVGVFGAIDPNQTKGLMDSDGDGIPDAFDHDENDPASWNEALDAYNESVETWDSTCANWYAENPDVEVDDNLSACLVAHGQNYNYYDSEASSNNDPIAAIGVDASYELTKNLTLYSQFAQLIGDKTSEDMEDGLGYGFVPLALQIQKGSKNFSWSTSFELRMNSRHFMYSFWDQTYDLNRVQVDENQNILTKRQQLETFGKLQGLYFNVNMSMFNLIDFDVSYQDMEGETWEDTLNDGAGDFQEDKRSKSILGSINFDTSKIPVLHLAKIYYQRSNDTSGEFDIFNLKPTLNTVHGYDIGVELSGGVVLVYKGQTTYISDSDGGLKPSFSLQVEALIDL